MIRRIWRALRQSKSTEFRVLEHRVQQLAAFQARLLRHVAGSAPVQSNCEDPNFGIKSEVCKQRHFTLPEYHRWCDRLAESPKYHRKQWEFVFAGVAFERAGAIRTGARALGFGVGREPIPAALAAAGVSVMATDLDVSKAVQAGWVHTGQHADEIDVLHRPNLIDLKTFRERVEFRTVDMNAIPDDLRNFDMVWSSCAFEHLGSIELGKKFVQRAMDCLRPGGVAVHTTEFNLEDGETIEHGSTVLFRKRDIEDLSNRLKVGGHEVAQLDLSLGDDLIEDFVDMPPYRDNMHLRLMIERFVTTSIGLVIRAGSRKLA